MVSYDEGGGPAEAGREVRWAAGGGQPTSGGGQPTSGEVSQRRTPRSQGQKHALD